MKLIVAMIQPHKLPEVKKALFDAEVHRMTVTDVLGCGAQKGYSTTYRGTVLDVNLLKKLKIEIAVNDDFVEATIEAIIGAARTGEIGDGKIFVSDLTECIRIRTGQRGDEAIG